MTAVGRTPPIARLDAVDRPVSAAAAGRLIEAGSARPVVWSVPEEAPVSVLINGEPFAVMMTSPADLEDFAVGFALTEGLVDRLSDIQAIRIAEARDGYLLNLRLPPPLAERLVDRRRDLPGRSGCGVCGAKTLEAALPAPRRVAGPWPAPPAVLAAFAAFAEHLPARTENRSTHGAAFCALDGAILVAREDIGRHNALDKLVGALAREGRAGSAGFVLLSSRLSVEMVQKTAALGAPFVASVSAPSALALRQARKAGLGVATLCGEALMLFDGPGCGERRA